MPSRTVTALRTLANDPGFCRVEVADRRFGPLRRDDAERLGIGPGTRWTTALERRVEALIAVAVARRVALAALARSSISRERLAERLGARGHAAEAIRTALDQLVDDGWLDEARAALERAEVLSRRQAMTVPLLAARLEAEGFGRHAAPAARQAIGDESDLERALRSARHASLRRRGDAAVARHLARLGFDSDTIELTMERIGRRTDSTRELA